MDELETLDQFKTSYTLFFNNYQKPKQNFRYTLENLYCRYFDGCIYFCMLNHYKPKRVIEVGCGNSSALLLDFDEYFSNCIENIVLIDKQLNGFRKIVSEDRIPYKVILLEKKLEDVDISYFKELQENDILYIDSSHQIFGNNDVHRYIFDILPILNKGVIVQIHDIYYPWLYKKRHIAWGYSEMFMVRLFLQYNKDYEIIFWNSRVEELYRKYIRENYPLLLKSSSGGLWIKKN